MIFYRTTFYLLLEYALKVIFDGISKNLRVAGPFKTINQIKVGDHFSRIVPSNNSVHEYGECDIISIKREKTYTEIWFTYKYSIDNGDYILYFEKEPKDIAGMGDCIYLIKKDIEKLGMDDLLYVGQLWAEVPEETFNKYRTLILPLLEPVKYSIGVGSGYVKHKIDIGDFPLGADKYTVLPYTYYFYE